MPDRRNRLAFPAQILATAIIVGVLVWVAHLVRSEEDSAMFDEAAQQTRLYFEGAARGVKASEQGGEAPPVKVERKKQ